MDVRGTVCRSLPKAPQTLRKGCAGQDLAKGLRTATFASEVSTYAYKHVPRGRAIHSDKWDLISSHGDPFWSTKKRKVATNIISYKRYGEILLQKVALCYLLHFVQDGSSKHAL